MSIHFDLTTPHFIAAANTHFYEQATEPLYLDRVLQYHDLIYSVEGSWAITEGETEYPLEKDDVLLLTAGHHHYTRLPCAPGTRTVCIHVSCEPGDRADNPNAICLPTHLSGKGHPLILQYFKEIVEAQWSDHPFRKERQSAQFNLLILALSDTQQLPEHHLAAQIVQIINNTPHRQYRVSEIASLLFVSERTVENAMHQAVGMSFSKYQMNRKLEMAAQQIRIEPDVRLAEIAATLGFYDEFHFSKAFKQKYGVSPSQYRNRNITTE